ncbi:tyrosine-type recombinase/integrase [Allobranchiibius sp. CTAmp26]|uniref:tyrosine-type recombinase/integrase n=1 Tax=Allobranchiibius sp. CTAmp26 TaxID=2815214 RepID=UPI001AA0D7D6|nr:tyrosine-type recombinase/integrase [Allobranchiibius sp. CTAmp26]MBO1756683.1 tyrosine-type recombinase/integrase family protein [Allobranchiibius sp. CTAmp26]
MTRAKRDFGTIRKRSNRRFQAYYMGPDEGIHRAPSTFQAKSDAEGWLAAERRLIQNDEWSPAKSRRAQVQRAIEAFGPYAESWLLQREVKQLTRALYRRQLDRFILPVFAEVSLRDITPPVVRTWYATLDPNTPTQRAQVYSLLRAVLNEAVRDDILTRNPCTIRSAGIARRQRPIDPASPEEIVTLMNEMPDRYWAFILIAAWCGLRFGELAELRRGDVDVRAGLIHVRRAVTWDHSTPVVGTPKNGQQRSVSMPPHIVEAVTNHLRSVERDTDALLFAAVGDSTRQVHSNTVRRHWIKARTAAGRPDMRLHDLRHTGAVLAALAGATPKETMDRLGHLTAEAAMRYQHVARGRDAEIAAKLSELAGY